MPGQRPTDRKPTRRKKPMKKWIVSCALALISSAAFAQAIPPNSQNLLWQFTPAATAGNKTKAYCATTAKPPYAPTFCFGEITRTSFNAPVMGYVEFQAAEQAPKVTLQIVRTSKWKFVGRDSGYVQNFNVYQRQLIVKDARGAQFPLIETFQYEPSFEDYEKLRTRTITGTLPDGTPLYLPNIYLFQ
jgi:hypothetical protein